MYTNHENKFSNSSYVITIKSYDPSYIYKTNILMYQPCLYNIYSIDMIYIFVIKIKIQTKELIPPESKYIIPQYHFSRILLNLPLLITACVPSVVEDSKPSHSLVR